MPVCPSVTLILIVSSRIYEVKSDEVIKIIDSQIYNLLTIPKRFVKNVLGLIKLTEITIG